MAAILSREGWVKQTVSVLLASCSTHISACYPLVLVAFAGLLFIKACMRHMMTSSNGNFFRVTGPLWRESTGHRWIPFTKARDAEWWCFFDLRLNKRLNKQPRRRWFETPSHPLWRDCNKYSIFLFQRPSGSLPYWVGNRYRNGLFEWQSYSHGS